jgi:hypothetical protein
MIVSSINSRALEATIGKTGASHLGDIIEYVKPSIR